MDNMSYIALHFATVVCYHASVHSVFVSDNNPNSMSVDFKFLQDAFVNLQRHMQKVELRMQRVEGENEKQRAEIADLKETLTKVATENESCGDTAEIRETDTPEGPDTLQTVKDSNSRRDLTHKRVRRVDRLMDVAFYANVKFEVYHLGLNQDIVFDEVVTNVGHAYSPTLGLFIAPVSGLYVFSTTILASVRDSTRFGFALNGKPITSMWTNGDESAGNSDSQTIVLNLSKGDGLSVKVILDNDTGLHGDGNSLFSGFLLCSVHLSSEIFG